MAFEAPPASLVHDEAASSFDGSGVNDGDFPAGEAISEAISTKGRLSAPIGADSFFLVGTGSSYLVVSYTGKKLS